ncbi:MAG: bifunctional isocitrate dehydrogenase kinase/phosphatase [Myxococcota bacterium]
MASQITDSRLANLGAKSILSGFADYVVQFEAVTRQAKGHFEQGAWLELHQDAARRLELYRRSLELLLQNILQLLGERLEDHVIWASMKAVYSGLIVDRADWDQAETFFNSISRKIFHTVGLNPQIEFVDTDFEAPPNEAQQPLYTTFGRAASCATLIKEILQHTIFSRPYASLDLDAASIAERIEGQLKNLGSLPYIERAEILDAVFYRGKRAFVIGRLFSGLAVIPLVIALRNRSEGIVTDAVLVTESDVSILFSFTRSYFHVDCQRPYDLVRFLRTLIPRKRLADLYSCIGFHKHGKTELYRELLAHLHASDHRFEMAPGVPGMVMIAFTLPGYDLLLKVIKDTFPPEKSTSREGIMDKYRLVFGHDRVGRMVEAQEFEHLLFNRKRFTESLLTLLVKNAGETVTVTEDSVVLKHVYVERRVIPLNIYLRDADDAAREAALIDFGKAIKDMAASNIFPGDLLTKNFGVTRHGRIVFYDYDELTLLTECNFRKIPVARSDDELMAAAPWFSVRPNDIFPEELWKFVFQNADRQIFDRHHKELYDATFWNDIKQRLQAGEVIHVAPYDERCRIKNA